MCPQGVWGRGKETDMATKKPRIFGGNGVSEYGGCGSVFAVAEEFEKNEGGITV